MSHTLRFLYACIVSSALVFISIAPVWSAEISVSPMLIEVEGKAGEKKPFSFNVRSKGKGDVVLRLFDISQRSTGHMQFVETDLTDKKRPPNWVDLDDDRATIKDGESVRLGGVVAIPRGVSGSQLVAVTVESQTKRADTGIKVTVRYAVVLKIIVKGKKSRVVTKIDSVNIENDKDNLVLKSRLSNMSQSALFVKTTAQIRNQKGKLVERVELKSASAWQRHDDGSNVIPGASIDLVGKITKITQPGNYKLIIKPKVDGRNRKVLRETINITHEDLLQAGLINDQATVKSISKANTQRKRLQLVEKSF